MRSFKTKIRSEQIQIDDSEGWELVELNGKERDLFIGELKSRYTDSKGNPTTSVQKVEGLQAFLVAMCLRDPQGNKVPASVIQEWNAATVQELYDYCMEKNGLGEKARDVGKKESAAKNETGSASPPL